jgi:UDP-N-acetylmuramate dehydrogenase
MESQSNVPLWRFTTLKVGGEATRFCQPESVDALVTLMASLKRESQPWFVLGGGSNLLVSSKGVQGTVIRTAQMTKITTPEPGVIEADAGARLPHLAKFAATQGLSGLEFSVGIPGTVGGGVIMNAGAHSSCMANTIESVTIMDTETGEVLTLPNSALGFEYRHCNLDPSRHVVLSARFRLTEAPPAIIEANTKHNEEYRWKTQPQKWPNAGSTFKNPEPTRSAGMLLDQAGAKNLKEGNAAVSEMHANFVINMGGATSQDVSGLLKRMQECVFKAFEVRLHPEWKTVGDFSASEREVFLS